MIDLKEVSRRKTFKSGFTRELIIVTVLSLLLYILLLFLGVTKILSPGKHDEGALTETLIFGYLPIGIAFLILIGLVAILLKGLNQILVITPLQLAYQKGKLNFKEDWDKLKFSSPASEKKLLSSFRIGTEEKSVRIYRIFFSKYSTIVEIIRVAKQSRKTRMID